MTAVPCALEMSSRRAWLVRYQVSGVLFLLSSSSVRLRSQKCFGDEVWGVRMQAKAASQGSQLCPLGPAGTGLGPSLLLREPLMKAAVMSRGKQQYIRMDRGLHFRVKPGFIISDQLSALLCA